MMKPRIGFKTHVSNSADGWGAQYLHRLVDAGIPPVVMALDGAGFVFEAQEAMKKAGWSAEKMRSAALVYRNTQNDIPAYHLTPEEAADRQWEYHYSRIPPELDRQLVWLGITNEPAHVLGDADLPDGGGRLRSVFRYNNLLVYDNAEWLAAHALRLCQHALDNGIRLTVLGWSAGTPEPFQWRGPEMGKLLALLRKHPEQLGIDLHEYSLTVDTLEEPALIGRWQNIPRPWPSIFVTEFGWTLREAPVVERGLPQVLRAYTNWYAHEEIKGLALWTLGKEGHSWEGIGKVVNTYIPAAEEPQPPKETGMSLEQFLWDTGLSASPLNMDAALQKAILADGFYPLGPEKWGAYEGVTYAVQAAIDWDSSAHPRRIYYAKVPDWGSVRWIAGNESMEPAEMKMVRWPVDDAPYITQKFGARPEVYKGYGFPGHEGVDIRTRMDAPVRAVANGMVGKRTTTGNYGNAARVNHNGGWQTLYAHLSGFSGITEGSAVRAGDVLGYAGSTGNSTGVHLHLTLSHETQSYTDSDGNRWPRGIHDPTEFLAPLLSAGKTDLLPYLRGSGVIYQMQVTWQGQQHSQQMQTQRGASNVFWQVKNHEWEEFLYDVNYILRGIDTSPGGNMYYWQRENALAIAARWCPRLMSVGQVYERNPLVTFYNKDNGEILDSPASGYHRSWLLYAKKHDTWLHPKGSIPFTDVVELHWLLSPSASSPAEIYFYARDYGLVGWSSSSGDYSFVSEVFRPGERSEMSREKVVIR